VRDIELLEPLERDAHSVEVVITTGATAAL
jgi:hypothetical protein